MKLKVIFLGCIILYLLSITGVWADGELLTLENKYIKVFVNNSAEETGRFAMDVTQGDPGRSDDDGKPLIYGHPRPWTSFTTIRIDGVDYVFGKATSKRAGAGLPGGEIIQPPKSEKNQLTMKCNYGQIEVQQLLDIIRSPSTGAYDTARIRYQIVNQGETTAEVGLRTFMDTMVGDNDGAPFRLGEKQITYEYSSKGNELPDFWQAFDALGKPAVIAQGTLKGGDVTTPNRIVFTNWGKAADQPWDFLLQPGTEFLRLGEDELDSAVVMYWDPKALAPGEQTTINIYFGLGGITFSPGNTFLGISAPAEVQYQLSDPRSYTVVMYMEHRGEANAKNVKILLSLPSGLELVSGDATISLAELSPGVTKQFSWEIRPNGSYIGDTSFQIKVSGDGLETNQVSRKLKIIGPPVLKTELAIPTLKIVNNKWEPFPLTVSMNLKNSGDTDAYNVKAIMTDCAGMEMVGGELGEKYLGDILSKNTETVTWKVYPVSGFKTGSFKIKVTGAGIMPLTIPGEFVIPSLPMKIGFSNPGKLVPGRFFSLDLTAFNLKGAAKFQFKVKYDPKQLQLIYLSRGTFLVENQEASAFTLSRWSGGSIDNAAGMVSDVSGNRARAYTGESTSLASLNFKVIGNGAGEVRIDGMKIFDSQDNELFFELNPYKYQIDGGK